MLLSDEHDIAKTVSKKVVTVENFKQERIDREREETRKKRQEKNRKKSRKSRKK